MLTPKKSEPVSLVLRVKHAKAEALAAAMITEANVTRDGEIVTISENSETFVDMRARWNSVLRGISAADEALNSIQQ
ncbi:MAG: hypothetical protein CND29_01190 [Marine Group II euryarchaeote MED-G36]|nr:MAG: hypothetical protein CND29_01190 [Marine Group II euryarchaeote MED-G36]